MKEDVYQKKQTKPYLTSNMRNLARVKGSIWQKNFTSG